MRRPHAMTCSYVAFIAAIVSFAGTPAALHGQRPADVRVGFTPLTLVAEGSRTDQFGGDALYTVAVYAEARPLDLADLARADAAKALRIDVAIDDDPFSPLTRPWRLSWCRRASIPPPPPTCSRPWEQCARATSSWWNTNAGRAPPSGGTR